MTDLAIEATLELLRPGPMPTLVLRASVMDRGISHYAAKRAAKILRAAGLVQITRPGRRGSATTIALIGDGKVKP